MASGPPWHCKDAHHISCRPTPSRATQRVTAAYQASMSCINTPPYSAWGVVLSTRPSDPLYGMHMMPDAVTYIVGRLRTLGNKVVSPQTVTIQHTSNTKFITFACVTPADALTLATAIETEAAKAP